MGAVAKHVIHKNGSERLTNDGVPESFFDFKIKDIEGKVVDFAKYKGLKAILVVNVACK